LIARAKAGDAVAWNQLAELYGPTVYRWSRQAGLQDSDAADVMQDVFRDVARGLDGFRKQRPEDSFRGWLWTITRNQLRRFFYRANQQPNATGGSEAYQQMQQAADILEMESLPDESHVRTSVVQRALELIRGEFQDRTWQAFFRMTAPSTPLRKSRPIST
jgi:RNA polymerase sigma-70 factor (ECF subfamily)